MTSATPSAAKPIAAGIVRCVILFAAGALLVLAIVYRRELWQIVAPPLAALGATAWSVAQKRWAAQRERTALYTPPPRPASAATPQESSMDLKSIFDVVKAALPPETPADALKLLDDAIAGGQALADREVEAALHTLPPAWQPLTPQLEKFADEGLAALAKQAEQFAALKAAVAIPAVVQ